MSKQEKYIEYKSIIKMVLTVLSWAAFSLLVVIGLFLLYYVVSAKIYASKGEDYKPPFSLYTIVSPSMEPKIKIYDVIFNLNVQDKSTLKKGDIITFVSSSALTNGMIITHRIIDITVKDDILHFRTKGDNNKSPDAGLQSEDSILGKTVLKIPQLGRIQFFLASRGGWIFAILIPAAGVIIYDIMKIFKLVGVKNKIDNVTKKEKPKPEENEYRKKKENILKDQLKRKFVLKDDHLKEPSQPPEISFDDIVEEMQEDKYQNEQEKNKPEIIDLDENIIVENIEESPKEEFLDLTIDNSDVVAEIENRLKKEASIYEEDLNALEKEKKIKLEFLDEKVNDSDEDNPL